MTDKVIEEIRRRRRKLIRERYDGSIEKLVGAGIKWQREHLGRVVSLRTCSKVRAVA